MCRESNRPLWPGRLLLLSGMLCLWAVTAWLRPGNVRAQAGTTATPAAPGTIDVMEPELSPAFSGDVYPEGWLRLETKSALFIYLAPNIRESGSGELVGQWVPLVAEAGYYRVEAFLGVGEIREYRAVQGNDAPTLPPLSASAAYRIRHADGETLVEQDQEQRDSGWVDLGRFRFDAGTDGLISLNNITGETNGSRLVTFSALRLIPVAAPTAVPAATASQPPPATPTPRPSNTPTALPPATVTDTIPATATPASPTATPVRAEPIRLGSSLLEREVEGGIASEVREISLDGTPVGQLGLSYPLEMRRGQRKNIVVDLAASEVFTTTLVTVINRTLGELLPEEALAISPIIQLTLHGPFDFAELAEPADKRLELPQGETGWNVEPQAGSLPGEAELNLEISVLSRFVPDEFVPRQVILFTSNIQAAGGTESPAWPWWLAALLLLLLLGLLFYTWRRRGGLWRELAAPDWSGLNKGLLAMLRQRFLDEAEFAELCFQLDQPYPDLAGQTLSARMRDLVQRLERQRRLPQLLAAMDAADALDHLEWQPIQVPLLRLLVVRLGDEQFRARFTPEFADAAFAGQIRSLAQRLAEEDEGATMNRLLALITDESTAASTEERQLIQALREQTQGPAGERYVPQLAAAISMAERS